jgi:hypothetical protein
MNREHRIKEEKESSPRVFLAVESRRKRQGLEMAGGAAPVNNGGTT